MSYENKQKNELFGKRVKINRKRRNYKIKAYNEHANKKIIPCIHYKSDKGTK